MGGAAALQHRVRRVRQASSRQARDGVGELRRLVPRARLGRAPGPREPGCSRAARPGRRTRRPRRGRPPGDARDRGRLLRRLEGRRNPLVDVGALRRRLDPSSPLGLRCTPRRHRRGERSAFRGVRGSNARARRRHVRGCLDRACHLRHRGRRSRAALLHVRDDRACEGHRARPPLHPGPRGVRLLPRGSGRRAVSRHGRVGVGCRDRAASGPVAARERCSASTGAKPGSIRIGNSTS